MKFVFLAAAAAALAALSAEAKNGHKNYLMDCYDWGGCGDYDRVNGMSCSRWSGMRGYSKCTRSFCCGGGRKSMESKDANDEDFVVEGKKNEHKNYVMDCYDWDGCGSDQWVNGMACSRWGGMRGYNKCTRSFCCEDEDDK